MSGAASIRKGKNFERSTAARIRDAMPGATVQRGLQYRSGEEVADVEMPVFWLELKKHRLCNIRAALRQAQRTCPPGRIATAITQDDRARPMVTMDFDDWLEFVREWWDRRER